MKLSRFGRVSLAFVVSVAMGLGMTACGQGTIGFMWVGNASIKRSASSRLKKRTRRRGSFSIRIFGTPLSHRQS